MAKITFKYDRIYKLSRKEPQMTKQEMGKEHEYVFIDKEIQMINKHLTTSVVINYNNENSNHYGNVS